VLLAGDVDFSKQRLRIGIWIRFRLFQRQVGGVHGLPVDSRQWKGNSE